MNVRTISAYFICLSMTTLTTEARALSTTCTYGRTTYQANTTFETGICSSGYCNNDGSIDESYTCCQYQGSTYELDSLIVDQNCTSVYCYGDGSLGESKTCCVYEGKTFELGTTTLLDPCTHLECDEDGEYVLWVKGCPAFDCDMHEVPGQCCPVCDGE